MAENHFPKPIIAGKGIFVPLGAQPDPYKADWVSLPYIKSLDDPKLYVMTSEGEIEIDTGGLANLLAGLGIKIGTDDQGKVVISLDQAPNTVGSLAIDSLEWARLPDFTPDLQSKSLLVINEGLAGNKPTNRIAFLDFIRLVLGRLQFTDKPSTPNTPGDIGNYHVDTAEKKVYMKLATGVGTSQWIRWNIETDFYNDPVNSIPVPINLNAANLATGGIQLTWGYDATARSFELFVAIGDPTSFEKADVSIDGGLRTFNYPKTLTKPDTQYHFELRAITDLGPSGFSNRASVKTPVSANQWQNIQITAIEPQQGGLLIKFNTLDDGGNVRIDYTTNAQLDANAGSGWIFANSGNMEPGNKGAKQLLLLTASGTQPIYIRFFRWGEGKDASSWQKQGPIQPLDTGNLAKPTLTGTLNNTSPSLTSVTTQAGVMHFLERKIGTSDWAAAGSNATGKFTPGDQTLDLPYAYRSYYTVNGVRSKYSDEVPLKAVSQQKLPAPKNLIGAHLGNGTVQFSYYVTNAAKDTYQQLQISDKADFSTLLYDQRLGAQYRFGDQPVVINYSLASYLDKTVYARVQARDNNGVLLPSDWVTLSKALTSALDMAVPIPSLSYDGATGKYTLSWSRIGNLSPVQAWVIDRSIDAGNWGGLHTTGTNNTTSFDVTSYVESGKFTAFRVRPKFSGTIPWNFSNVVASGSEPGTQTPDPDPIDGTILRAAVDYHPGSNTFLVAEVNPGNANKEAQLISSSYNGQWNKLSVWGSTVGNKTYNTRIVINNLPAGTYTINMRTVNGTQVTTIGNVAITSQGVVEFYPVTTTPDPDPEPEEPKPTGSLVGSAYSTSN
ncbi:hypothetical protein BWI93_23755 [Siphonobacter sp. BAB-5385]|uniref:fibronectin type III domain-containing protein n=1 Tax=Siphonobacter sp. BAB-5385 TaxID=1864822 RepID=UPI000B9E5B69|nr:fibronectin type III domain-containing protein [Siphonobacter sp. BAB-5385]OZI05753.1 hypothetical protein BWI93_23755 [Siphonobacter sp. BAB-5385]